MAHPIDPAALCVRRTTCRICQSGDLELVLPLAPTPLASQLMPSLQAPEPPTFPLDVALCRRCGLVQLLDVVDAAYMFGPTHVERTSRDSPVMAAHLDAYAFSIRQMLNHDAFVVEIGSNDGYFLGRCQHYGLRTIGVDPAADTAADASTHGLETWPQPFTNLLAEAIRIAWGRADCIVANNVLANIDDIGDVVEGIRILLKPSGLAVIETGYLGDLVGSMVFDNIYHEHLSYFSVLPLVKLFADHGLEVFDIEHVETKGGSIRVFVQHIHGPRPHTVQSVGFMAREEAQGLLNPETYRAIGCKLQALKTELHDRLADFTQHGRRVIGYGVSDSVITLLAHFDIAKYLECLVDDNPLKHGKWTPGSHRLLIRPPTVLADKWQPVDFCVILPWRFASMISSKHAAYRDGGGRFVIPVPEVRIV